MADARTASSYEDIVVNSTTDAQLILAYAEAVSNSSSTTEARLATQYVEAIGNNTTTTESRISSTYIEVISPSAAAFAGWGMPL